MVSTYFKYASKNLFGRFFFFLVLLYGFFIAVDYAAKSQDLGFSQIWKYYLADFFNRDLFFVPLSALLALSSFYLKMNQKGEVAAALSSGISKKRIAMPAIILAIFATFFLLFAEEWATPEALYYLEKNTHTKSKKRPKSYLQSLNLKDGSFLLFAEENASLKTLSDVFWIPSWDTVWYFDTVFLAEEKAHSAFHYERIVGRGLFLKETYDTLTLPWLGEDERNLLLMQPAEMPLSVLFQFLSGHASSIERREPLFSSYLIKKTLFPFIPLIATFFALPYCLVFRRRHPTFLIYAGAILGFIILSTFFDAALFLSKRGVIEPLTALFFPFVITFTIGLWHYLWKL